MTRLPLLPVLVLIAVGVVLMLARRQVRSSNGPWLLSVTENWATLA
jgi:hypothetical protein